MPALLDVNDAFDQSFLDDVVVIRRAVTVNSHGRTAVTETPMSARAVVQAATPNDLRRLPEEEWMDKAITASSPSFRFQGPAVDEAGNQYLPDHILWNGSVYVVRTLSDYSNFGRGFVTVVATSIVPVDPPPMPDPLGNA